MAKKAETVFSDRIRPKLMELPNTRVRRIQQMTIRGDPDFSLCINGLCVDLELKRSADAKPMRLQRYKLQETIAAGGIGLVVFPENWQEVYDFLKRLANSKIEPLEVPECLKLKSET